MKSVIAFALLLAVAAAVPVDPEAVVKSYTFENIGVGEYNFGFETSDGKYHQEKAVVKNAGLENEALEVTGKFGYVDKNNVLYEVTYIANEKGFQPSGAHLPKA